MKFSQNSRKFSPKFWQNFVKISKAQNFHKTATLVRCFGVTFLWQIFSVKQNVRKYDTSTTNHESERGM